MNDSGNTQASYNKRVSWIAHLIVSIIIVIIAFSIITALFATKPEARRWGGGQPAPSVAVDIAALDMRDYDVWISSYGTAEPLTRTQLVADVSGKVVEVSPNIRAGARFTKGEVLVQLDDRDFTVEVDIAAASAAEAQVRYLQEVAEAEYAAQQWNKQPTSEAAKLLALRKPQVAAAKASLKAAEARLSKAKLDLERTRIRAPFDGKVLAQNVDVGQVISPTQAIASIYSTDAVEVRLPIKIGDLDHLSIPDSDTIETQRPKVVLTGELGSTTYQWQGEIVRSEGAFDPATRMLYVVAQIDRPFTATEQRPAIRVGQFLRAQVQGRSLESVFVIPRRAVSQDNKVSVADDGVLRKRTVQPLWTDANNVIVAATSMATNPNAVNAGLPERARYAALKETDQLILTPTANLPDGTKVKSLQENQSSDSQTLVGDNNQSKAGSNNTAASQR